MQAATLVFLISGYPVRQVLLGLKKAGFGQGKFGGFGGKVESHETVEQAAIRELKEEAGIIVTHEHLQYMANLAFKFPNKPAWNQRVYAFVAQNWLGQPLESTEMKPVWFKVEAIPYHQMWQDCFYWLPLILKGQQLEAVFTFKSDNEGLAYGELTMLDKHSTSG